MKKLVIYLVLIFAAELKGSSLDSTLVNTKIKVKSEINNFISEQKATILGKGKYFVPVLKFYYYYGVEDFCFYISYIMNEYDLKYYSYPYYSFIDENLILIDLKISKQDSICLDLFKIENLNQTELLRHLYPSQKGGISGINKAMIVCKKDSSFYKKIYENSDDVPNLNGVFFEGLKFGIEQK